MKTLSMRGRAGADGVLHLNVPVDEVDCEYQVTVVVQPIDDIEKEYPRDWPQDFFEAISGRWIGEFQVELEGVPEERNPLE